MDQLLQNMEAALRQIPGMTSRKVFITPHENFIPAGVRPPCIGLTDGGVKRVELAGEELEETLLVTCVAMVPADGEGAVVGDKGVIALVKKIDRILDENLLAMAGMESAWSPASGASQLFATGNKQWLVKKSITYEYQRTRQRGV